MIKNKVSSIIKIRDVQNTNLWRAVSSFAKQNKGPFTCKDVKEHLMTHYGVWIDTNIWRKILKEKLAFSYKWCSSRPLNHDYRLQELKKTLFVVKLLKIIRRSTLLVNIDEWIISYSTKSNYSWSKKGVPVNLSTTILKGSLSVVSAICSNGVSITGIRKGTMESSTFIEYIDR